MTPTRSAQDRSSAWDSKVRGFIVVAALAPMVPAFLPVEPESPVVLAVDLASWAVFLVDLIARMILRRGYLRKGSGLFDLSIVVFTFPWYVLPGVDGTQFLAVFRLARLVRLATVTSGGRRLRYLYDQLGPLLIGSVVALLVAALIVMRAEPPESGFETFGDAMWWGMVTLTTVGYGDFFPTTQAGRFAGLLVMFLGLVVLRTLAGVLASMFGGAADATESESASEAIDDQRFDNLGKRLDGIEEQLGALRNLLDSDRNAHH